MLRSLNARLLLTYVIVILVCLFLVGLGLLLFARSSPLWTGTAFLRLEAAARATLPALQRPIPPDQLPGILSQIAEEQEIRVLLVSGGGQVRFDSEGSWEGEKLTAVERLWDAPRRVRGVLNPSTGGRWVFVGQVLPARGGERQAVLFVSSQGRLLLLAWFVENLLPPVLQAGAVALILSVLLALLITRWVAAPLRRVAAAAEAIARGEVGTRAPVSGPTEARALARSFNSMAEQVEAAQRSQRDFVANVSHELKTPLTSIQGFSQALLDGTAATPEAMARAARVIHEEAERMHRMVAGLLILARFDAGQQVLAHDVVELAPLGQRCAERLAPQAQAASVSLAVEIDEDLRVVGDADRLAQVVGNLLDNAIAHTSQGGTVTLEGHRTDGDGAVELTVTDTGEGIPAEALPRIFERFYQVDKSRRRSRGAGLGLAISREIVEAHGGKITAESVVGLGSRFIVQLPATQIKS